MILHGEQSIEIIKTLPLEGQFDFKSTVLGVYDKGKGMLIKQESVMVDAQGTEYVKLVSGVFVRGLGGFGGEKQAPETSYAPPARAPDAVAEYKTSPHQALLYRLNGYVSSPAWCYLIRNQSSYLLLSSVFFFFFLFSFAVHPPSDYNPLHADPTVAKMVSFPAPILHGLATFGIAASSILQTLLNNDPKQFKALRVRFASPVFPGETLVTEMWKSGKDVIFQSKVKERNVVVLSNAVLETTSGIPSSKL